MSYVAALHLYRIKLGTKIIRSLRPLGQGRSFYHGGGGGDLNVRGAERELWNQLALNRVQLQAVRVGVVQSRALRNNLALSCMMSLICVREACLAMMAFCALGFQNSAYQGGHNKENKSLLSSTSLLSLDDGG